jgi:two pore calcium channel protein
MLLQFESYSDYTPTLEYLFGLQKDEGYQRFRQFILSKCFEHFIDFVIILNTAVVLVQSYPELSGQTSGVAQNPKYYHNEMDIYWEYAEAAFTVIYTFEMTIKIIILGWKKYTSMARNIFDGFITILAILATAYVYYPNSFNDPRLIRYIIMARVLRCARIFMTFKPFEVMGKTFLGILPSVGRVAALLFCAVYMFSGIGMHFFGGLITRDPNNATSYLVRRSVSQFLFLKVLHIIFYCKNILTLYLLKAGRDCFR